jgi:hypothetical protein
MKRLGLTQHSLHCPLYDCAASLSVRTDSNGYPSRRHLDVTACSLLPSTSFPPSARRAYFPDMEPPMPYTYEVNRAPLHSTEIACSKRCLSVMNAAECGAAGPVRCTSGVSDALELARHTQSPAIMRLLWLYSV